MPALASLLILAALGNAASGDRQPDAVTLYQCGFEQDADEDYDNWPDGWTRRRGAGFPHYLPVQITADSPTAGGHSLRFDLDGAAAAAYSPPIAIDPRHDYVLHASLTTRDLVHDRAWLSVVFLDENRQPLETIDSEHIDAAEAWLPVRVGPLRSPNPAARWAKIALHLEPGDQQDLHGSAMFDDIWFAQVPRMELRIDEPRLLYQAGEPIGVHCRISGYRNAPPEVQLELSDALGEVLARRRLSLEPIGGPAKAAVAAERGGPADEHRVAEAAWTLPLDGPGYYCLNATVSHDDAVLYRREIRVAVAKLSPKPELGEFGWTLPKGEQSLPLTALVRWASQAGVHWIKFPLWYDAQNKARVEELTWFADRLNAQNIGLIGLLCDPPPETRRALALAPDSAVANVFALDPAAWYPSLEPVMARLALKVGWWQLGHDDDSSLAGLSDPVAAVARVKTQLDQIGQSSQVGVVWDWMDELPRLKNAPWAFVSRSSHPALAANELTECLSAKGDGAGRQWVSLAPLDPERYDARVRAADLALRLIAAKQQAVDKIFFNDPLNARGGLVRPDGSAGTLLLPWRTTALALAGAQYLGRLELPGGSENRVFVRGGQVVMALWSGSPATESIDFGEQVEVSDLWGRVATPSEGPRGSIVRVGTLPLLVSGLSAPICRWKMSLATDRVRLPSVSGAPHHVRAQWQNYFDQPASVKLKIVAPAGWRVKPELLELKMAAEEKAEQTLELTAPSTASCRREWLRFEFDVQAGRHCQFSVRRPIELGLGDVYLELTSHLNAAGELEVEQRTVNRTGERVSFRCHLSAPNRRRMRTQVWKLPPGEDVQSYRLPGGDELIGQTLRAQAEEVGGQRRLLNYNFIAEP